jgi:hypothetical protein
MDPAELEFLAENDAIEVVPNFTHAQMHLIQVFGNEVAHAHLRISIY